MDGLRALVTMLLELLGVVVALGAFTAVQARRLEARYPLPGRRVEVGGGAIHVLERPASGEERAAILLIHGASGNSADLFLALSERLSVREFRVVSLDRPGHGFSARIGGRDASAPVRQADALRQTVEKLGVTEAVVVGHSLGAITALAMALEAPGFVRALVLIAPVSHPWLGGVACYYRLGAHSLVGPPFRRCRSAWRGCARRWRRCSRRNIIVEAERRATAAATPYAPTVAMRRLLVPPTVPNGTPATTMMRSPGPAKPSI